jgi:broad specificity phosphatase PhoE
VLKIGEMKADKQLVDVGTPLEGKVTFAEFADNYGGFMYHPELIEQGGERASEIWHRVKEVIGKILKERGGNSVVVVSHGDPVQIIKLGFQGINITGISPEGLHTADYPKKGSVTRLEFEGENLRDTDYWPPPT